MVGQDLVAAGVPQTLRVAYPDLFAVHDPAGAPLPACRLMLIPLSWRQLALLCGKSLMCSWWPYLWGLQHEQSRSTYSREASAVRCARPAVRSALTHGLRHLCCKATQC